MSVYRSPEALTVGRVSAGVLPLVVSLGFAFFAEALTAEVALSFVVLGLVMSLHCLHAIHGRSNSAADASVFVFGLMFLLVAPIVQILVLNYRLVNTTYARPDLLVEANLACSLFIAVYLLCRVTVLKPVAASVLTPANPMGRTPYSSFSLAAMLGFCVFITLFSLPFVGANVADQALSPVLLAFRKFLFFVPTAVFLIVLAEFRSNPAQRSFLNVLLLLLMLGLVIATQNPATEKRNGLGPVYLAILFFTFRPFFQRKGVQVAWLVGVLLVLFPLAAVLTTVPWRYLDQLDWRWDFVSDHFLSTHYDAWANIYTSIEMVANNGLSGGKQLAGALLFYVPSTWWSGKPLATGIEIGNFLITNYSMWFTNLSAPLIAEGFLDFGYLGVVAYAIGLAALVKGIERWSAPERSSLAQAVAMYLAFFIVFLLRGSLMIAIAYGTGALLAFFFSRALLGLLNMRTRPRRLLNAATEHVGAPAS